MIFAAPSAQQNNDYLRLLCKSSLSTMLSFQLQQFFNNHDDRLFQQCSKDPIALDSMRNVRIHRNDITNDFLEIFLRQLNSNDTYIVDVESQLIHKRLRILSLNPDAITSLTLSENFKHCLSQSNLSEAALHDLYNSFQLEYLPRASIVFRTVNDQLELAGILPRLETTIASIAANDDQD